MSGKRVKINRNKLNDKLKAENVKLHNDNQYLLELIQSKDRMVEIMQKQIEKWSKKKNEKSKV